MSRDDGKLKTKSQLRAEAVERLRELNCMDVSCFQVLEAAVEDAGENIGYRVEIRKLIDLLTDDEAASNAPSVDAVTELREFIDYHFVSGKAAWTQGMAIADMVESDYVRVDSEDNPGYVRRQRYIDMKAERDELQRQLDTMYDVAREFRVERDEWKAEAKTQRNNFKQATGARKYWQRKYESLKAASYSAEAPSDESELARELGKALASSRISARIAERR